MEIKTKFEKGQEVFFLYENKIKKSVPFEIEIKIIDKDKFGYTQEEKYWFYNNDNKDNIDKIISIDSKKCFETKQELIQSL